MAVHKPTILVVDDDLGLLVSLSIQLEQAGYRIVKTSEVSHAELLFIEHQPDLVVLEVNSNHGAGWSLLERVAGLSPVIVVSCLGLEEDIVRGMELGAADYLTKPYRLTELLTRVRIRMAGRGVPEAIPVEVPTHSTNSVATNGVTHNNHEPAMLEVGALVDRLPLIPQGEPVGNQPPIWVGRVSTDATPPEQPSVVQQPNDEDEPVFIDSASEAKLLAAEQLAVRQAAVIENFAQFETLPLGQRFSAARRYKQINLMQAEMDTRVRLWYLQAMEDEKFSLLPRGDASEQMVRSYAKYLGLDIASASDEFRRLHYNPPVEPVIGLGNATATYRVPRWLVMLLAVVLALVVSIVSISILDPGGTQALLTSLSSLLP